MTKLVGRERTVVARICDGILDLIKTKELGLGDRLPSEERLVEDFGVARPTLREALKILEQDGIIRTEHGRGRFVMAGAALHIERPITTFESVTDMVEGYGYSTTTQLLKLTEMAADDEIASGLQCLSGTPVLRIERLRSEGTRPILYSIDFIKAETAGNAISTIDWSGSLVQILRRRGVAPVASTANVSATLLPADAVKHWKLADFGPVLLVTETCFTAEGTPILFAKDYHHGKYFTFSFARR
ncbi:transcriptional regulator, GntR family with UTRA sensor domain containing protein [Rhizobium sp. CF080]|uniref:GntR family transcriptional regulator n=1 Tax=Rhizobium sp. (strain CF080) TaxID=1144310 RepID=UPI000271AC73|nr:GntR family transcriptional regulator [Rhizobium sp. CF080]EUB98915.1 transcriptional regulator, GntR family with UTRA sensor domain containing protein [Rhizobium sp. CF080]